MKTRDVCESRRQARRAGQWACGLSLSALMAAAPAAAKVTVDEDLSLSVYGDFRLRVESDWDSHRSDGSERGDRTRMRIRGRVGLLFEPSDALTVDVRVRTGAVEGQQSPHITVHDFDDNSNGPNDVLVDRYYVKYSGERFWAWGGRNLKPFWRQNELFWDDDVTIAGGAVNFDVVPKTLRIIGGAFALPDGGVKFHGGSMYGVQGVYDHQRDALGLTFAGGLLALRGDEGAEHLLEGNGERDYTLWQFDGQMRYPVGGRTMRFGVSVSYNSEAYSADDPDAVTAANHDQTQGYVFAFRWGDTSDLARWDIRYHYGHVEKFAVNASYAQDDWVRWGSPTQSNSSDLKGHAIRFGLGLHKSMNVVARLYLVDAITSVQDGKRFRIDYNWRF